MIDNPIKCVGDTVDSVHTCTNCLYYFPENKKLMCEAPVGVNRLCMQQFKKWKIEYIKKWFPEVIL